MIKRQSSEILRVVSLSMLSTGHINFPHPTAKQQRIRPIDLGTNTVRGHTYPWHTVGKK